MLAVLALLTRVPLLWKVISIVAVALSLWGGFAYWKHSIYKDGFRAGEVAVQEEWNASVRKEIEDGNEILREAEHDAGAIPDDSGVFAAHPWNRDNRDKGKP